MQWPTRPLPHGPRRPLMQISKKIALQLPKPRVSESRPVEVGTNIEVEALLVSGHCLKLFIFSSVS